MSVRIEAQSQRDCTVDRTLVFQGTTLGSIPSTTIWFSENISVWEEEEIKGGGNGERRRKKVASNLLLLATAASKAHHRANE